MKSLAILFAPKRRQHLPTTMLPKSWLTGFVASKWRQHLPTTTLPQSSPRGLVTSRWRQHLPAMALPQSWLTGLVASTCRNATRTSQQRSLPQSVLSFLNGASTSQQPIYANPGSHVWLLQNGAMGRQHPPPPNNDLTPSLAFLLFAPNGTRTSQQL